MVEIFKITGKRIVFLSIILYLIGAFLLDYHIMFYDMLFKGQWPEAESTKTAIGGLLVFLAPIIWKARNVVRRAVS